MFVIWIPIYICLKQTVQLHQQYELLNRQQQYENTYTKHLTRYFFF